MRVAVALVAGLLICSAAAESRPDALTLLTNASKQYAGATSYHIEEIEELIQTSEFERHWLKRNFKAIVEHERYRFEVRSELGAAVAVSDGKTTWHYHPDEHLYTAASASEDTAGENTLPVELGIETAKSLVNELANLRTRLKSARSSGEEDVQLNGRRVRCIVLQYSSADLRFSKPHINEEETVWIDKSSDLIVRIKKHALYSFPNSQPQTIELVRTFPVAHLNVRVPETVFAFFAPPDAKLVPSFPKASASVPDTRLAEFLGKQAPDLQLHGSDGTTVSLSAYRGKPIFIDFWAGWCAPCVDAMPELKALYLKTAPKGVVWMSVDSDDDSAGVDSFLAEQQIPWPNYHDSDGSLGKAFGRQGLPLGVLIDAEGKVIFYKAGYDIADLRAAIAKLNPSIQSVSTSATSGAK